MPRSAARESKQRSPATAAPARGAGAAFPGDSSWRVWRAGLMAVTALRLALAVAPSAAFWGLHAQAYVAAPFAWPLGLLPALALLPAAGAPIAAAFAAAARALDRLPALALGVAAAAAGLVLAFPDRLFFVGDFLLRLGSVRGGESPAVLSPQAFPLDVLLHYTLPLRAVQAGGLDAALVSRAIGAIDAALLAAAALLLARALPVGPAARAAAFAVAFFGGALALMTGESKAFAEMVVLTTAFAGLGLRVLRREREGEEPPSDASRDLALLGAGIALAVGFFLHRLTLGLLPAWLLLVVLRVTRGGAAPWRSVTGALAIGVPILALGFVAPRLWSTTFGYDLGANFGGAAAGGGIGRAFAPLHLLDVANQLMFLSPVALVALTAAIAGLGRSRREPGAGPEGLWMLSLAAPAAAVMLLLQPPQGVIRDWEAYAPSAAAISAATAWAAALAIERSRRAWLAAAVVLAAASPTVQWLAHFSDRDQGLRRLEALMTGPPERPAEDRATTWNFIGWAHFRDEAFEKAALAFERACEVAPSPRLLTDWAMAETLRGDAERARELYARAVERDSTYRLGWVGLGVSAINTGRPEDAARAARALERLDPDNPKTREIADWVKRWEAENPPQ